MRWAGSAGAVGARMCERGRVAAEEVTMTAIPSIMSARLELVPATLVHVEAELESAEALGRLLGATVPASWPPGEYDRSAMEFFRTRLAEEPASVGWYGWYAVQRAADGPFVVIGAAGYLGPPGAEGTVEVGYSIAPEFRARGYATGIVQALLTRAWSFPAVRRVIAHAQSSNVGSAKVLERCGFRAAGPGGEPGTVAYEVSRPTT
jgi:[ribosomal protein S5]-alanine N-acetyltransferase